MLGDKENKKIFFSTCLRTTLLNAFNLPKLSTLEVLNYCIFYWFILTALSVILNYIIKTKYTVALMENLYNAS